MPACCRHVLVWGAASVAQKLQDDFGLYLNGLILLSSVLDFGSQDFENPRWDEASAPSFLMHRPRRRPPPNRRGTRRTRSISICSISTASHGRATGSPCRIRGSPNAPCR